MRKAGLLAVAALVSCAASGGNFELHENICMNGEMADRCLYDKPQGDGF
jgi:hypothetical protein